MHQSHAGGEKLLVDYAGDTVPVVVDRRTAEVRAAKMFVAVIGGSSLSLALATWTEQFPDWIVGNDAALAFFRRFPVADARQCHGGGDHGLSLRSSDEPLSH